MAWTKDPQVPSYLSLLRYSVDKGLMPGIDPGTPITGFWHRVVHNGGYSEPTVLKKGGLFLSIANFAADPAANEACVFKNFLLKSDGADLADLVAMVEQGKLKVTFDSTVKMGDAPAALTKSFKSENAGKIVVAVAE